MTRFVLLGDGPGYVGFLADFNTTFWSALLRIAQAMVAAAPFLVAGALAAGVLRGMVGADRTRKILGVGHWSGPLRAWGLGVLLPICSLGALPVARELRRAGVPSGTVLSFVLVAPVLNPVSIIYGLSHIDPTMLLYFGAGTFVVSVGIGAIWNRLVSANRDSLPDQLESAPRNTVNRLKVVGHTTSTVLIGPAMIDYGLALLAVGFLGAFLPHGALQTGLTRDNALAPIIMGIVAIPVYVTPTDVMMHFGHIVQDGFSLGAAFALIVLGAGANVGVANWVRRDYGLRPLALFVSLLIFSTLIIGLTADRTIVNGVAEATDHTHAFDPFTRLSQVDDERANIGWVLSELKESTTLDRLYGLGVLGVIVISGCILRMLGKRVQIDRLLEPVETSSPHATSKWNPALTPRQLTTVAVAGAIGLAIVGLFVFYPPVNDLVEDMNDIRVSLYDAVREGDLAEAKRRAAQLRSQLRKLPTSVRLRWGRVDANHRESVDEVLYSLNEMVKCVESGNTREAMVLKRHFEKTYNACRRLFRTAS